LLGDKIVAVPYGDEHANDSNWGLVFDTVTKETTQFDIQLNFGGKYRFRCGIEYNGYAFFFPSGTPSCPIIVINDQGYIVKDETFEGLMFGRPIIHKNHINVLAYHMETQEHFIYVFGDALEVKQVTKI
jgi:hypothetical protein